MGDVDEEINLGLIQFLLFLVFEQLHVVGHCPFGLLAPGPEGSGDDGENDDDIRGIRRVRCPPGRQNGDVQPCRGIAPVIRQVGGPYLEGVIARMQFCEIDRVAPSDRNPFLIHIAHSVCILDGFRGDEVERGEVDAECGLLVGQRDLLRLRFGGTVDDAFLSCLVLDFEAP